LFDALADKPFAQTVLDAFTRHRRFRGQAGELLARTTPACPRLRDHRHAPLDPLPVKAPQSNTSIAYGDQFMLKVFRWVDEGVHPDVEIAQALAEKTDFTQ